MAKAIAINALKVCSKPAVMKDGKVESPPQIDDIAPGKTFECSDDDLKFFVAQGAAKGASKSEDKYESKA